ncbi:hypothetical protein FACS1894170_11030 [Planctomycetales bacterium]|nr:hypothetical protein FACS1894170_11030 [Planctomycetales bacterium]
MSERTIFLNVVSAALIHKDYAANLKFGKVWGSAVHDGTVVKGDYVLNDQDVIEVHV